LLSDPSKMGDVDENDPKSVARMMKRMGKEMGDEFGARSSMKQSRRSRAVVIWG